MRREADFDAATELANGFRFGICMTNRLDNVEALIFFDKGFIDRPLATAKDSAATSPHVGGEATAVERKPEGQGAQHGSDCLILMGEGAVENLVDEIEQDFFTRLSCINDPAFNPNAEITVEKVFQIDTTAPSMVSLDVAIVWPIVLCKNISAPQTHVKLLIGVPLWTWRWNGHMFNFLSGIL